MTRVDIINSLIQKFNFKSYLEIGIQNALCFNQIKCKNKIGVDPDPTSKATIHLTSDEFFAKNSKTFDIIMIDGLHEAHQVYKDIENSLKVLNKGGIIVCHDMNPLSELAQRVPRETKVWNGDCWKALVVAHNRFAINRFTVDTDHGCAVIRYVGSATSIRMTPFIEIDNLKYEDLEIDRKELLNLISVEEFKQWLKQ